MNLNFKTLKELSSMYSILYVEDDSDIRESTASVFSHLFQYLTIAKDGKEGLQKYLEYYEQQSQYFDIVT